MTFTVGTDNGIGDGARAATPTGREATTPPPFLRYATGSTQRVRAFMRVTRRAKGSTCCRSVQVGGSAWPIPDGGRREPAMLWSDVGGPSLLTEDRQKPCHAVEGMHGTR